MSRKNRILGGVVIVMVAASAFILYKGFYSSPSVPSGKVPAVAGSESVETGAGTLAGEPARSAATIDSTRILPLGTKFDFGLIKKYNADTRLYSYPKVDPFEVGATLNALVKKTP